MTEFQIFSNTPQVALAIGAHPDDIEFGCGATLAKWAQSGTQIYHLVLTDGSKGTWDPTEDTKRLVLTRKQEQRSAQKVLGGTGADVFFLGQIDGELTQSDLLRAEIARIVRSTKPEVVLSHDPWKRYRLHPDHRNAGFLVVDALVAARDPHFYPEQGIGHHRPNTLLLFEADEPDTAVDVSAHLETKIAALMQHRSQLVSTMHVSEEDPNSENSFRQRVSQRAREVAINSGLPNGLAEAFKAMSLL